MKYFTVNFLKHKPAIFIPQKSESALFLGKTLNEWKLLILFISLLILYILRLLIIIILININRNLNLIRFKLYSHCK